MQAVSLRVKYENNMYLACAVVNVGDGEMWTSSSWAEPNCICFVLILAWCPSIGMACDIHVSVPELQPLNLSS